MKDDSDEARGARERSLHSRLHWATSSVLFILHPSAFILPSGIVLPPNFILPKRGFRRGGRSKACVALGGAGEVEQSSIRGEDVMPADSCDASGLVSEGEQGGEARSQFLAAGEADEI